MNENRGKYFTTGEFADLCNVKKQTLFHYDDIGLLSPEFKNHKGYRFYSFNQYEVFTVIELLKTMDMPLKEIKAFMSDKTPAELTSLLKRKSKELEKKRAELNQIQKLIDTKIAQTELAIITDFTQIYLEDLEARPLYLSVPILNCSDREYVKILSSFSKEISQRKLNLGNPVGALIDRSQILNQDYENYTFLYIEAHNENVSIFSRPSGLYLTGYHLGSEDTIGETYMKLMNYMSEHNLYIKGNAYEEYILDEVAVNGIDHYVTQIQVEVEREGNKP